MTTLASNRLDPSFTPNMLNGMVRDGELSSRFGYNKIGSTLDGQIRQLVQFGPLGGVTSLLVLTTKRQYFYAPATDVFTDITKRDEGNTEAVTAQLKAHAIRLVASAVGGNKGRKMMLDPATGEVQVEIIGEPAEII